MVVKKYTEKKVSEYLIEKNPRKVLIVFYHGLGDLLMFLPLYQKLRNEFKDIYFDLCIQGGVGHEYIFPEAVTLAEVEFDKDYDIAFVINFPMSEGREDITKGEFCCQEELGISKSNGLYKISEKKNNLVALHLNGTCLPHATNPDEKVCEKIWGSIVEAGYVPMDVHMEHLYHNKDNVLLPHTTRHCRDLTPQIETLHGIISGCFAFVGVASGPFVIAASIKPDKTIYLEKGHKIISYVHGKSIRTININKDFNKEHLIKHLGEIQEAL